MKHRSFALPEARVAKLAIRLGREVEVVGSRGKGDVDFPKFHGWERLFRLNLRLNNCGSIQA